MFRYDPLHPDAEERNRVRTLTEVHVHGPDEPRIVQEMGPRVGIGGHNHLRALVCDGPVLLLWVGGVREDRFTLRDHRLFSSIVPSLQRSLAPHRRLLDAQVGAAGLDTALETLGAPSVVAHASGDISDASASARALLAHRRRDMRAHIRDAILRRPAYPWSRESPLRASRSATSSCCETRSGRSRGASARRAGGGT